eukprot:CAMPEP_0180463308 /NCGR_PEP_ID=MMETSP1036_2-20121128/24859_2 /TAXON_ID=632150 /ORGANISM="Azadinium spinosum, Strain 3D9" /LENGTH=111 /DNA_ID=CAMNT_0022470119 /DNA_START=54 /DNA_END=389 /DNA_ORIENTATION=-
MLLCSVPLKPKLAEQTMHARPTSEIKCTPRKTPFSASSPGFSSDAHCNFLFFVRRPMKSVSKSGFKRIQLAESFAATSADWRSDGLEDICTTQWRFVIKASTNSIVNSSVL